MYEKNRLPPFNISISKFPNYAYMEKRCSDIDAFMDSTSNGHDGKMEYEYDYQSKDIVEVLGQALHGLDPDIIIINNGIWYDFYILLLFVNLLIVCTI